MTTTQVKDAGNLLNIRSQGVTPAKGSNITDLSFQNVLNGQTDKNPGANQTKNAEKSGNAGTPENAGKLKNDNRFKANDRGISKKANELDGQMKAQDGEEAQETGREEAMQVLMTAALGIVETVTEVFEIPAEELQSLMDEMGLSEVSLLDPENLSALLMAADGVSDQAQLLTDGELYDKFQTVMKELDTVLAEDSGLDDLSVRELDDVVKVQMQEPGNPREPEITVEALATARENEETVTVPEEARRQREPAMRTVEGKSERAEVFSQNAQEALETETVAATGKADTGRDNRSSDRGERHQGSLPSFVQRAENAAAEAVNEAASEIGEIFTADTQDIMRQIMDYMRVQVKPETTSLEMQLHPASLGTIHIQLQAKGGVVTANFIAQNETVKAALESQIVQLRENFEEQGVKVEAVEVTVETHQFEQNLEQNNREQNGSEAPGNGSRRIRRLNLNEEPDIAEGLDEADRIAAEIMEANGNTVDYTA